MPPVGCSNFKPLRYASINLIEQFEKVSNMGGNKGSDLTGTRAEAELSPTTRERFVGGLQHSLDEAGVDGIHP